jgi:hypothetical protein
MTIYSAEDEGGGLFIVAAWDGLDRASFKEFVLDNLSRNSIPEPDRNIQDLSLCEWEVEDFVAWWFRMDVPGREAWKNANFATLYWTYPGVWSENRVTRMPAALAASAWDGEGVDRSDPKHPDFHDTMAGIWDNRDKGAS